MHTDITMPQTYPSLESKCMLNLQNVTVDTVRKRLINWGTQNFSFSWTKFQRQFTFYFFGDASAFLVSSAGALASLAGAFASFSGVLASLAGALASFSGALASLAGGLAPLASFSIPLVGLLPPFASPLQNFWSDACVQWLLRQPLFQNGLPQRGDRMLASYKRVTATHMTPH